MFVSYCLSILFIDSFLVEIKFYTMEKSTKRHHVPIDERVKDIHKDSVKLLYNSIINSMKDREVKATELETKKSEMENKRQKLQRQTRMKKQQDVQKNLDVQKEDKHVSEDCSMNLNKSSNSIEKNEIQQNLQQKEEKDTSQQSKVDDSDSNKYILNKNDEEKENE